MRGDFAEIIHKIVDHPQSIVSFSVIFVAVGVLLIVVALSANSKVMNYIGVGFIVIGVAVFVLGAAWFYTHSKARQARLNDRTNLRLISLQALEEEGVKSSREGSMKGSIRGSMKEKHHSSHCELKEIDENEKQTTG
jgi:predicted membrane channel-forming protein YqfA (hemolysin III family)